jgi:hypothetical protein
MTHHKEVGMDETTTKVLTMIQTRWTIQFASLIAAVSRPIPGTPLGQQVVDLTNRVPHEKVSEIGNTVMNQIRLLAGIMDETTTNERRTELFQELMVLDGLIQAGLSRLWSVPPHSETQ